MAIRTYRRPCQHMPRCVRILQYRPQQKSRAPHQRSWLSRRALSPISTIGRLILERIGAWMVRVLFPEAGPPITDQAKAWRNSFWGGVALASVSREPARHLLPKSEDRWRTATWRHFRFVLIRHLHIEGAHSLGELVQDPPQVLGLPLNRQELSAVIDSAYRRGEVEELQQANAPGRQTRWIITEKGQKATSHWLSWMLSQGSTFRVWVAPVATTLSVFGIGASQVSGLSLGALAIFSVLIGLAVWIGAAIRSVTSGYAAGRRVARDWHRWGEERPNAYRLVFRPFPWRRAAVGVIAAALGIWAFQVNQSLGVGFVAVGAICFITVLAWKERWASLEASSGITIPGKQDARP